MGSHDTNHTQFSKLLKDLWNNGQSFCNAVLWNRCIPEVYIRWFYLFLSESHTVFSIMAQHTKYSTFPVMCGCQSLSISYNYRFVIGVEIGVKIGVWGENWGRNSEGSRTIVSFPVIHLYISAICRSITTDHQETPYANSGVFHFRTPLQYHNAAL